MMPSLQLNQSQAALPIRFNPFDPQFKANPYPIYHYLRSHEPVHWGLLGGWVLTRYADVKFVLRDPRFHEVPIPKGICQKSQYLAQKQENLDALAQASSKFLFFLDPPDHTRMRGLVSKAFKTVSFEQLHPQIQAIANDLVAKALPQGCIDVVADFADLLPIRVIARILGLPEQDCEFLLGYSKTLFRVFDPLMSLKACQGMNQLVVEFTGYLLLQIAERRRNPRSDLLTALLLVEEAGERLSEDEVIATCMMLTAAGERTTAITISNGMLALLHHREQLELLKRQSEILPMALEEILRYDSATQLVARMATELLELGGKTVKPGDYLILCLGAANRDPLQFPDPDRLDLKRANNQHVAFATGIHFCAGAGLARIEVPVAINTLIQKLPNPELVTNTFEYGDNVVSRSLKSLPITFDR